MRSTSQALHSGINAVEKARCKIMKSTNHVASTKDEEMGEHQPWKCSANTSGKTCLDGAMIPSKKDSCEPELINDKLEADSTQGQVICKYPLGRIPSLLEKPVADSTSPYEVLRDSDIKELTVDSASVDEVQRSKNYDESQRITADHEEDGSDYDPEQKKEKPEPKLRVVASEADLESHIVPDPTAMTKQEHVDDCCGDGDEEGVVEQEKVNRRQVDSSIRRIVNSLGIRTPNSIKYESMLQKLVKAGLEWIKPLQDDLAEEVAAVRQDRKQKKEVMKHHQKVGFPEERALPGSKPFPLTSLDYSIQGDSLNWDQVQARSKTAWEFGPADLQWRNGFVKSRVKALKVTLKYVLSGTLRGEEPTRSYSDLCTLLALVANAVNERPVAL